MAEITRRDMIAGGAIAASALAGAGILASTPKPALAAHERLTEAGANAGWGDMTLSDGLLDTPFGEAVDSWFNYSWSYTAEFEPDPDRDHVTIIVSSATVDGNGDTLAQTAVDEIGDAADVEVIHLRDLFISPLMTMNGVPPVEQTNTQLDGMQTVIDALHRANIVIAVAPTYYNNIDARMMTAMTRLWGACWQNPDYQWGPVKRTALMLTCTGTSPDWLKTEVRGIFTMADMSILSPEYNCEVFSSCGSPQTVANNDEYLERARALARWAIRAE